MTSSRQRSGRPVHYSASPLFRFSTSPLLHFSASRTDGRMDGWTQSPGLRTSWLSTTLTQTGSRLRRRRRMDADRRTQRRMGAKTKKKPKSLIEKMECFQFSCDLQFSTSDRRPLHLGRRSRERRRSREPGHRLDEVICVHPSIRFSTLPLLHFVDGRMDGWTDGRVDANDTIHVVEKRTSASQRSGRPLFHYSASPLLRFSTFPLLHFVEGRMDGCTHPSATR
jgi:hypothetical protein